MAAKNNGGLVVVQVEMRFTTRVAESTHWGVSQSHDANQIIWLLFVRIRYKAKYIDLHFLQASWASETNYTTLRVQIL